MPLQSPRKSTFRCRTGHPERSPFHSPLSGVLGFGGLHAGRWGSSSHLWHASSGWSQIRSNLSFTSKQCLLKTASIQKQTFWHIKLKYAVSHVIHYVRVLSEYYSIFQLANQYKKNANANHANMQWCSLRDTQVYAVYPLGKSKDFRIPT